MKRGNIVVTGGAGFIGSHLTRKLSRDNNVIVIDNLSTGHIENIKDLIDINNKNHKEGQKEKGINGSITDVNSQINTIDSYDINGSNVTFIKGDVRDPVPLRHTFRKIAEDKGSLDYVYHLAAIASVPQSIQDPITTHDVNVTGILNVLTAAKEVNAKKVIFSSSCAVYGNPSERKLPITETLSPHPISPYATSKLMGEQYCNLFNKIYSLPTVVLRYFNVYGPRQDQNSEYAAVIPKFITSIISEKPPTIYGDGTQTRDFTFVNDVVNANILAAESRETGVFNIASGKQTSINELAKLIMELTENHLNPIYKNPKTGDIMHSFGNISKAKEKLNYKPKFELRDGVNSTINLFRKNQRKIKQYS